MIDYGDMAAQAFQAIGDGPAHMSCTEDVDVCLVAQVVVEEGCPAPTGHIDPLGIGCLAILTQ